MRQKICGVYLWTNLINGKMYVGVSIDIKKRWTQHKTESKTSKRYFYRAIRKYGIDNFNKTILETFDVYDRDKLKERGDYFINYYDSLNKGYNRELGYNSITTHPDIENIKKKISDKAKDRKWINNGKIGMTCNSIDIENYIKNGWVYGRLKFTDEHIKSMSESHIGNKLTEEAKIKTGLASSGRLHSEETKKMMSEKLAGRYSIGWYIDKYGDILGKEKYHTHHDKSTENKKNRICITNGVENKSINKDLLIEYEGKNWVRGRTTNKK